MTLDLEVGIRAARVGLITNGMLGTVKMVVGVLGGSLALTADGFHSLTDLAASAVVWVGLRVAQRPADACHPYGHRRAETIAAVIVAVMVVVTGGNLLAMGAFRLSRGVALSLGVSVMITAAISVIVKELLFRYQKQKALLCGSTALLACAWEQRADAMSSLVVLVAVAASAAGLGAADAAAGALVGLMVVRVGWKLLLRSLSNLMDKSASSELLAVIQEAALTVKQVQGVDNIRTRVSGSVLFVDMVIRVNGQLTVTQGHDAAQAVERAVAEAGVGLLDLVVHVEPE